MPIECCGSIEIGEVVIGGGTNRVLYVDGGGLLRTEAAFTYDETTNTLGVQKITGIAGQDLNLAAQGATSVLFQTNGAVAWRVSGSGNLEAMSDAVSFALGAAHDVVLNRDAANSLGLRNGAAVQTFSVYSTYTSGTNYERLIIAGQAGGDSLIYTEKGSGGGTARGLSIGTNGTLRWQMGATTGHFFPAADNTYNIGSSGARVGIVFHGPGTAAAPSVSIANVSGTANDGLFATATNEIAVSLNGAGRIKFLVSGTGGTIQFTSAGDTYNAALVCEGSNILALKNSTTAQEFRIYGTTTGPKYLSMKHDGTNAAIGTAASSGYLQIGTNASSVRVDANLLAHTDATYDIGASGATRFRDMYLSRDFVNAGFIRSAGATSGIGYASGAGGTVTQITNKSTGVTLSKVTGQITMNNAALAGDTTVSFTLTNTAIAATDILLLNHISGGTVGSYLLEAQAAAGSATITVRNITTGSLSEAIVIAFAVVKAVTA